jgi:hypothetical protein
MNRRTFLSALAATSLTPLVPAQIFASGGIVNPEHCGYVGEMASDYVIPHSRYIGIDPISMLLNIVFNGDGTERKSGLVTVTTGPTWAEKTQAEILEDIRAFLAMPIPEPADRIILPKDRYTRYLRA